MLAVGAEFVREDQTVPAYRLYSIGGRHPGMVRVAEGGVAVAVEVRAVPPEGLASILLKEPPGLSIGKVRLASGHEVLGVLPEPILCDGRARNQPARWMAGLHRDGARSRFTSQ